MKNKILLLIVIAHAILIGCKSTPCADVLFKKDTTIEAERKNTLFAFVGEKIDVKLMPGGDEDHGFEYSSKYKVLQRIYGCYPDDTIEFTSYDHYGSADFMLHKNILLYVTENEGKYEHQHYLYDRVYMTKTGKWAGTFEAEESEHYIDLNIFPERMDFKDSVTFPLKPVVKVGNVVRIDYPHPIYRTIGDKAIADYGISIENVFKAKKHGSLAKMRFFTVPDIVRNVFLDVTIDMEEEPYTEEPKDHEEGPMQTFWKKVFDRILQKDTTYLKQVMLDTLWVCGSIFTKQKLMSQCYNEIFNSRLISETHGYFDYKSVKIDPDDLLPGAHKLIVKEKAGYRTKEIRLDTVDVMGDPVEVLYLNFIKTKNGFRLYDIRYPRNRSCCF